MAEEEREQIREGEKPKKNKKLLPILLANLVVIGIAGYFVNNAFGDPKKAPSFVPEPYYEFSLDKVTFSAPANAGKFMEDIYQMVVKLSINPAYDNVPAVMADLEKRKSFIRDRIFDLIAKLPNEQFSAPDFAKKLKKKIKDIINVDIYNIKSSGEEIVVEVIIPDRVLPATR